MGCAFSKLIRSCTLPSAHRRQQNQRSRHSSPEIKVNKRSGCSYRENHNNSGKNPSCSTNTTVKLEPSQTSTESEIDISHFRVSNGILGVGGFGVVQLVERAVICKSQHPERYAMKSSSKESILKRPNGVHSVMSELRALSLLKPSKFICNIQYAFQDETYLYLMLELVVGGDMRLNLRMLPNYRFPEPVIQFYAVQLFLAIDACHQANILHRGKYHQTDVFSRIV
jgi:hypothetical protein